MSTLYDVNKKIEEIRDSDFIVEDITIYYTPNKVCNLLRKALICKNYISSIDDASKENKKTLYNILDDLMKNKLKKLNPNFTEEILNKMTSSYDSSYFIYPMDIFILDDAVFFKEGVFDDFGSIYKVKTFMFKNQRPYYNVSDIDFVLVGFDIFSPQSEQLNIDDQKYISKFISDNINSMYKKNITRPIYELNTETMYYGCDSIVSGEVGGVNVYINMKFKDIGKSLKSKEECDIKVCIQEGEDITLYYVHQSFKDDKPIWNIIKTNNEVWRLTDEVLKKENECKNTSHQLTKRKK